MPAPTFSLPTGPAAPSAAIRAALSCMATATTVAMMKKSIKTAMKVASATIIAV